MLAVMDAHAGIGAPLEEEDGDGSHMVEREALEPEEHTQPEPEAATAPEPEPEPAIVDPTVE